MHSQARLDAQVRVNVFEKTSCGASQFLIMLTTLAKDLLDNSISSNPSQRMHYWLVSVAIDVVEDINEIGNCSFQPQLTGEVDRHQFQANRPFIVGQDR